MTKLFIASDLHKIKKYLEKEDDWIALIDNKPDNIPKIWIFMNICNSKS